MLPPTHAVQRYTDLLALLANPTRLKILLSLQSAGRAHLPELCVCDLAVVTGASMSMTSHQLRLLRTAGLVQQRRAGKLVFYCLANQSLDDLLRSASGIAMHQVINSTRQRHGSPKSVVGR